MRVHSFFFLLPIFGGCMAYAYKIRGPPMPPRPPTPPGYVKKWYMGNRFPQAYPRPMYTRPMQMAVAFPLYKPRPMLHYPKQTTVAAPLIFPSSLWKQPIASFKSPIIAKPTYLHISPHANLISPEYHISKPEPVQIQQQLIQGPITQVDEKGPIHTIPAPNLSLADKPIVVAEFAQNGAESVYNIPPQQYQFQIHHDPPVALGLHQYQVTEQGNDHGLIEQSSGQHKYFAPDPDPSIAGPIIPPAMDPKSVPTNSKPPPSDLYSGADPELSQQQLSSQEILKLLQGYPQQQLLDSYGLPLSQQPQLQQHLLQQSQGMLTLNTNTHTVQSNPVVQSYFIQNQEQQPQSSNDLKSFQPQYQNFNYDEQTKQNSVPYETNYNLEGAGSDIHSTQIRNTQSAEYSPTFSMQKFGFNQPADQMVQSNQVDSTNYNIPDPATIYAQLTQNLQNNYHGQVAGSDYYASVPNQEVADKLASLQAAGQILSQQNTIQEQKEYSPMRIVVPDEDEDVNEHDKADRVDELGNTNEVVTRPDEDKESKYEFEDYSEGAEIHEEVMDDKKDKDKKAFGSRLKLKGTTI